MRHLRAYLFDEDGVRQGNHQVSSAMLPHMPLRYTNILARDLTGRDQLARREACTQAVVAARRRRAGVFGVALICCPDREDDPKIYRGSFAIVGAQNQLWCGDATRENLVELEQHLAACVKQVRDEAMGICAIPSARQSARQRA